MYKNYVFYVLTCKKEKLNRYLNENLMAKVGQNMRLFFLYSNRLFLLQV